MNAISFPIKVDEYFFLKFWILCRLLLLLLYPSPPFFFFFLVVGRLSYLIVTVKSNMQNPNDRWWYWRNDVGKPWVAGTPWSNIQTRDIFLQVNSLSFKLTIHPSVSPILPKQTRILYIWWWHQISNPVDVYASPCTLVIGGLKVKYRKQSKVSMKWDCPL